MPGSDGRGRIAVLDGIRGLAILLVLVHHYMAIVDHGANGPAFPPLVRMATFAFIGVDIFFVLSGFLIGGIILRHGHENGFLKRFYLRRAARLLPLYLAVVTLYAMCGPYFLASATPGGTYLVRGGGEALPLWTYFAYLQNFAMAESGKSGGLWLAATWSLAIEEQFYLFAPLLLLAVARHRLPVVLVVLACLSPIVRILLVVITNDWVASYVLLPARWDALIVGILGALALETPAARAWIEARRGLLRASFLALGLVMLVLMIAGLAPGHPLMITFGLSIVALFGLSLIAIALLEPGSLVARLLENRQLVWLGGISYGVYLIHHPMLSLVHWTYDGAKPRLDDAISVALNLTALGLTLCLAVLSWRYFEKPILSRVQSSSHHDRADAASARVPGAAAAAPAT